MGQAGGSVNLASALEEHGVIIPGEEGHDMNMPGQTLPPSVPTDPPEDSPALPTVSPLSQASAAPTTSINAASTLVPPAMLNPTSTATTDGKIDSNPETRSMNMDNANEAKSLSVPTPAADDQDSRVETDRMDVDKLSPATDTPSSGSTNVDDTSKVPAWLSGNGMLDYLCGVSEEKAWQQLVSSFVKFETFNTATGVCN